MAKAKSKTIYGVHPVVAMMQKWASELKEKNGEDQFADRSWLRLDRLQKEAAQAADRYARTGKEGRHHPPH